MTLPAARPAGRRRLSLLLLALAVLVLHLLLVARVLPDQIGDGANDRAPKAMDVAFVKALMPTLPPVAAAAPPRSRPVAPPEKPAPAASAASAPEPAQPASAPEPLLNLAESAASAPLPDIAGEVPPELMSQPSVEVNEAPPSAAVAASQAASAAVAAAPASSPASGPAAFDWPPSTRLSYALTFANNGPRPLRGSARVEWLRQGERYQVRVTASVPALFERRMLSDGVLGPQGLSPRRFDQETDLPLMATRRETVRMENGQVLFVNGKQAPALPGLQDASSQFVQMTWWFLTHPDQLQPGQTLELPLALARRQGIWRYQVQPPAPLSLPFGAVQAYELRPQVENAKPNEILVTIWIAPSLQYLPVQVRMRQGTEASMDMVLESAPLQAAR